MGCSGSRISSASVGAAYQVHGAGERPASKYVDAVGIASSTVAHTHTDAALASASSQTTHGGRLAIAHSHSLTPPASVLISVSSPTSTCEPRTDGLSTATHTDVHTRAVPALAARAPTTDVTADGTMPISGRRRLSVDTGAPLSSQQLIQAAPPSTSSTVVSHARTVTSMSTPAGTSARAPLGPDADGVLTAQPEHADVPGVVASPTPGTNARHGRRRSSSLPTVPEELQQALAASPTGVASDSVPPGTARTSENDAPTVLPSPATAPVAPFPTSALVSPQTSPGTTVSSGIRASEALSDITDEEEPYPPCVYVRTIHERYFLESTPIGKGSFGEVFIGWRKLPVLVNESATEYEERCKQSPPVAIKCMKPAHPKLSTALAQAAAAGIGMVRIHRFMSKHMRRTTTAGATDGGENGAPLSSHRRRPSSPGRSAAGMAASDSPATKPAEDATPPQSTRHLDGVTLPTATSARSSITSTHQDMPRSSAPDAERRRASMNTQYSTVDPSAADRIGGVTPLTPAAEQEVPPGIGLDASMLVRDRSYAQREADLLKRVRGHDHVVTIVDHCDDGVNIFIVLEYCAGGDLMKYVLQCKQFSERIAAYLFRQMLLAVQHCHQRGVAHRDIKPDNFLFVSSDGKAHLKITDFGLAAGVSNAEEVMTDAVGSAYFIAPEVFKRRYTLACDVWSLGIVLYLLLSGTVPFGAKASTARDVHRSIRKDALSFNGRAWTRISASARELVAGLLEKAPYKRYTIDQALRHPWVAGEGAPETPIERDVIERMYHFNAHNKLRREALRVVASTLTAADIARLRTVFFELDTNADNAISARELAVALRKSGLAATGEAVQQLMTAIDTDGNGLINLDEFLAATTEMQIVYHQNNVWYAFCQVDRDGDGFISAAEAESVLGAGDGADAVARYMREYDLDADGRINYEEFIRMLLPRDMRFTMVRF